MGFFNKLKENIHHGGIKLDISAPGKTSLSDAEVPVTVTLTASEPANIKWVKVEMLATPMNMAFNAQGMTPQQVNQQQVQQVRIVALNQENNPFSMAAGETKTLQLNIVMNSGSLAGQSAGNNQAMATIAKAASALETFSNVTNPGAYKYSIKASANVEGIALDPSKTVSISVNNPGQFGSTTNISI